MPVTSNMSHADALRQAGRAARGDLNALGSILRALVLRFGFPSQGGALVGRSEQITIPTSGNAKAGATAGWVMAGATNLPNATLPASQTNSTLVVPIIGLNVGDTINAFSVGGQIESAGGTVTMTADLRKMTNAAADNADASVANDTLGAGVTADTILSAANLGGSGLAEVVGADESFYMLITGTTAAVTDIDLTHVTVTVTRQ